MRPRVHSVVPASEEAIVDDALPALLKPLLRELVDLLRDLHHRAAILERQIISWHRQNDASQRLAAISGVGPLTASAMVASIPILQRSRTVARWRRGSGSFPANIPVEVGRNFWELANVEMPTCEPS